MLPDLTDEEIRNAIGTTDPTYPLRYRATSNGQRMLLMMSAQHPARTALAEYVRQRERGDIIEQHKANADREAKDTTRSRIWDVFLVFLGVLLTLVFQWIFGG